MKRGSFWLLCAALVVSVIALAWHVPDDRARLVLAPDTCAALASIGVALAPLATGCLYTGPVGRDFLSIYLGTLRIPRASVLVEMPLHDGTVP